MARVRVKILAACVVATVLGSALPAEAAKLAKPAKPTIVGIKRVSTKGKYGNYQVFVEQGANKIAIGITTEITADPGKSCKIKSTSNSCTLTKLKINSYYRIKARSKNKAGYSKWSSAVALRSNTYGFIRAGYDTNGKRFPSAFASTTYRWKTLGTSSKWTKFQALKRSGVSSASARPYIRPRVTSCNNFPMMPGTPSTSSTTVASAPDGEPCVVFQVSGIVGLAAATSNSSCGSNVSCALAVQSDGSTTSLFISGSDTPPVKDFYSAPNGKLYVVFNTFTRLVKAGPQCVLVEVNVDTGIPTCVDKDMGSIVTSLGNMYGISNNGNAPVQFDAAGNIYYMGTVTGGAFSASLRSYTNGTIRNIVSDNISIRDFVVLGNGNVLVTGSTTSTNASWIREYNQNGGLKNLLTGVMPTFMRVFADGNVYFGLTSNGGTPKIVRYLVSKGEMDTNPWISSKSGLANEPEAAFDRSMICGTAYNTGGFCQMAGVYALNFFNFGSTKTIGVAGVSGGTGNTQLIQYWPTLEAENTIVTNISIAYRINDKILITGTDARGKNILTIYDPESNQEQIILDGSNEVEIYSFAYVPATNKLMFNGLQFADNKYVVAEVALP